MPAVTADKVESTLEVIRGRDRWRQNSRSIKEPWVGIPIAQALGVDLQHKPNKKMISTLVRDWITKGWLEVEEQLDDQRNKRDYVVAGSTPRLRPAAAPDTHRTEADDTEDLI
jgi:hypothetical protein